MASIESNLIRIIINISLGKLAVRELFFEVPRDYSKPDLGTIQLFARAVTKHSKPITTPAKDEPQKPWAVFLEGGPGFPPPPPARSPLTELILDRGYQLLYLDPRGTGLSTPVSASTLALKGGPSEQAAYLMSFRADSIVEDCEAIRRTLTRDYPENTKKWSVIGQSFGGFCILNYLSKHPSGLAEAFTLGGLGALTATASEVYELCFAKVIERNNAYYNKYPEDIATIRNVASYISSHENGIPLPGGGTLTVPRLLTMGSVLGFHGGIDEIHDQILRMSTDLSQFSFITRATLAAYQTHIDIPFDSAIIYAILHEPLYNQKKASNWAAYSVGRGLKEFQWLRPNWTINNEKEQSNTPLFFSGEMIFPFMFDVYPE